MKRLSWLIVAACTLTAVTFTSCKKDNSTNDTNNSDYTTEFSAQSDDQARVSSETDAVSNDADNILDAHPSLSGRPFGVETAICDATVQIDSINDPKTVTINYDGSNCNGHRTRTGTVILSMPLGVHWADPGAVLTVTYSNLVITRVRDGRSITLNGTTAYTNVSGGRLRDLASSGTITHTISSNGLTVTFDNGSQRTWQIAKQRVFTYDNGIVITTTGTHNDGTNTNVSEWGSNRFGNNFATSITTPMVVRQDCDFRLVTGQVTHHRLIADVVVTFGLDAQGLPTACPGSGTYYYKLVWTGIGGIVRTVILPY